MVALTEALRVRGFLVDEHLGGDDVAEGGEERRQVGVGDVSGQVVDEQVGPRGTLRRPHVLAQRIQHVLWVDESICPAVPRQIGRGGVGSTGVGVQIIFRLSIVGLLGCGAVAGAVQRVPAAAAAAAAAHYCRRRRPGPGCCSGSFLRKSATTADLQSRIVHPGSGAGRGGVGAGAGVELSGGLVRRRSAVLRIVLLLLLLLLLLHEVSLVLLDGIDLLVRNMVGGRGLGFHHRIAGVVGCRDHGILYLLAAVRIEHALIRR